MSLVSLGAAIVFGLTLGLVFGAAFSEGVHRQQAFIDAGIELRRLAQEKLNGGEWQASGALRQGAILVEQLDGAEPAQPARRRAGA